MDQTKTGFHSGGIVSDPCTVKLNSADGQMDNSKVSSVANVPWALNEQDTIKHQSAEMADFRKSISLHNFYVGECKHNCVAQQESFRFVFVVDVEIKMSSGKYIQCRKDKSHYYNSKLGSCPFCEEEKQSLRGALSGWLCSFDLDPNGVSYELRQGVNKIGSDKSCHIQISGDPNVSAHAADIVIQGNECHLQCLQKFENTIGINGRIIAFGEKSKIDSGSGVMIGAAIYYYIRISANK